MCKYHNDLFGPVALIAFLTTLLIPSWSRARYLVKRTEAARYAVSEIGDRKAPFTEEESKEWYKILGAEEGEEPSRESIDKYLKECNSRKVKYYEGKL